MSEFEHYDVATKDIELSANTIMKYALNEIDSARQSGDGANFENAKDSLTGLESFLDHLLTKEEMRMYSHDRASIEHQWELDNEKEKEINP